MGGTFSGTCLELSGQASPKLSGTQPKDLDWLRPPCHSPGTKQASTAEQALEQARASYAVAKIIKQRISNNPKAYSNMNQNDQS